MMTDNELSIFNHGVLNGWLKAVSRFNDKSDHGHDFTLFKVTKGDSIHTSVSKIFNSIANSIEFREIEDYKKYLIDLILNKWFFSFQDQDSHHLVDAKNSFSLYDSEWKEEWVEEFVDLLLTTTKPVKVYNVTLKELKGYYANDFINIIIESNSLLYHLHFSVSD